MFSYMTLALSKIIHLNKHSELSVYNEGSERGWSADQKPVLTFVFAVGHVWILAGRDWSPTSSRGKPLWLCRHTNTRRHKHYNPTIIHTQRQQVLFQYISVCLYHHLHAANKSHAHICFTNKNSLKRTKNAKKKRITLPPPWQMCWDSRLPLLLLRRCSPM